MAVSSEPASRMVAWTKSDANKFAGARAIYVGTAGDLVLGQADGSNDVTLKNASGLIPVAGANMIKVASTAADFVLFY